MSQENNKIDPKNLDAFDELVKIFASRPDEFVSIVNVKNLKNAESSIRSLREFLDASAGETGYIMDEEFDPITGTSLIVTIKAENFVVDNMIKFCKALSNADTFEIYPVNDDLFAIGIVFNDIKRIV